MNVESLLQLRDSLIAKACLNKMELKDSQDILKDIEDQVCYYYYKGVLNDAFASNVYS